MVTKVLAILVVLALTAVRSGVGPELGLLVWVVSVMASTRGLSRDAAAARVWMSVPGTAFGAVACSVWLDMQASRICDPPFSHVFELRKTTAQLVWIAVLGACWLVVDGLVSRKVLAMQGARFTALKPIFWLVAAAASGLSAAAALRLRSSPSVVAQLAALDECPIPVWVRHASDAVSVRNLAASVGPPVSWLLLALLGLLAGLSIVLSERAERSVGIAVVLVGTEPLLVALVRGLLL